MSEVQPIGAMIRKWRERRGLSQLALAVRAEVSSKHVSFVETGRAQPSREMVLHLAELLDVPLRERNVLLVAAGFAPVYQARALDDPALAAARAAVAVVLRGHEPYPALAVDRYWNLLSQNRGVAPLLVGVTPALLKAPVNVLRLSLHPDGLAPRIANLAEWRTHLLLRLRQQIEASADARLSALHDELLGYASVEACGRTTDAGKRGSTRAEPGILVPLRLRSEHGLLSFMSTTTVFGTPVDITLAELAIESFFPADEHTSGILRTL